MATTLMDPLPELPPSLIAKILSFNVQETVDLAYLRLVLPGIVPLVSTFILEESSFIRCPEKSSDFSTELIGADWDDTFEDCCVCQGDEWEFLPPDGRPEKSSFHIFEGALVARCQFLKDGVVRESLAGVLIDEIPLSQEYRNNLVEKIHNTSAGTPDSEIVALLNTAHQVNLLQHLRSPPETNQNGSYDMDDYQGPIGVMLNLIIPKNAPCIFSTKQIQPNDDSKEDNDGSNLPPDLMYLRAYDQNPEMKPAFFLEDADLGRVFPAFVIDQEEDGYLVVVFMSLLFEVDAVWETLWHHFEPVSIKSPLYDPVVVKHQQNTIVEGVAIVDGFIDANFQDTLNQQITALAKQQEESNTVDYHPHSNNIVRDLVHPALYSYVKGTSPLTRQIGDVEACKITISGMDDQIFNRGRDFWDRRYEDSKFQWLPTYFSIDEKTNEVKIEDYINNLVPRENHTDLYKSLAKLFQHALPFIESVYGYVCAIRHRIRQYDNDELSEESLDSLEMEPKSLRGQKVQIITKIVDYELLPGQSHEGVWHVEGMSHEEIVLTCLYILDRDENIKGGNLYFKRTFLDDEAGFLLFNVRQTRHPYLDKIIDTGLAPLGQAETLKGRLIVFPNFHVHKVNKMMNELNEGDKIAKRRIVVFFMVNPLCRIISTREVPPQQECAGGTMSIEQAKEYRLELMAERKFMKQDWNVRQIELCEH